MKTVFALLVVMVACSTAANAQNQTTDTIPPNPKDVETVNAIVSALYDVISGPSGQKRDWNRMRSLFIPEARMIPTGKRPDGTGVKRILNVEDYIKSSGPLLEKDGFFEKEIGRQTEEFGGIVHVFSTYESKRKTDDLKPFMRGINSIQLWNDGRRWWIVTILWQSESESNPLPQKYLGK
jgi:hypothetical protein